MKSVLSGLISWLRWTAATAIGFFAGWYAVDAFSDSVKEGVAEPWATLLLGCLWGWILGAAQWLALARRSRSAPLRWILLTSVGLWLGFLAGIVLSRGLIGNFYHSVPWLQALAVVLVGSGSGLGVGVCQGLALRLNGPCARRWALMSALGMGGGSLAGWIGADERVGGISTREGMLWFMLAAGLGLGAVPGWSLRSLTGEEPFPWGPRLRGKEGRHRMLRIPEEAPEETMPTPPTTDDPQLESHKIGPDDPRYRAVVEKRFNKRFLASPDYVRFANSTGQVIAAVEEAVREGRRLVVTSGGHCLEGFVADPQVRVILDVSPMKGIEFDTEMRAIAVEAGATVGETFRALHEQWGTMIPLGEWPEIGMGGHVAGGAFGFLCRQHGLAADYLQAVEVVTVDADGRARPVVATREASDPNHDLWWAHTGAGGGNFGVVTRYWFRAPDAEGTAENDPAKLLPRAPESITTFKVEWDWSEIDEPAFLRLLQNHGEWCEQNSGADSPHASFWTLLELHREQFGKLVVRGVSTAGDAAKRQREEHLAALSEGILAPHGLEVARMSWLEFALNPLPDLFAAPPGGVSAKVKDALLRKRLTDRQIGVAYRYLTSTDYDVQGGMLGMATYGGRINTVAPEATASAQRGSILDMACNTGWLDRQDEAKNLAWARDFYRELFAESGGVPVPGEAYDGSFINHPDTDHADPALNTSGVPWPALYYRDNYPRLQRIKARWDPRNVFRHALSIQADPATPAA